MKRLAGANKQRKTSTVARSRASTGRVPPSNSSQPSPSRWLFWYRSARWRRWGFSIVAVTAIILVVVFSFGGPGALQAATYTWTQNSWAGGSTSNTAVHPTDATGWTEFGSNDATVSTGSTVSLQPTTQSVSETTDTDFGAGTTSSTQVDGSGSAAYVQLQISEGASPTFTQYTNIGSFYEYDPSSNAVWVSGNSASLTKYGADGSSTTALATLSLASYDSGGGALPIAYDSTLGVLWAIGKTTTDLNLVKINVTTASVINNTVIETDCSSVKDIRYDSTNDVLWVAYGWTSGNRILKVDTTGTVQQTISTNVVSEMAVDPGTSSIWYVDGTHTVYKQPQSGASATTVDLTATYNGTKHIMYESATPAVWVTSETYNFSGYHRILASDNSVTSKTDAELANGIAYDSAHDVIWTSDSFTAKVFKINRTTPAVITSYAPSNTASSARIFYDSSARALWFNDNAGGTKRMSFVSYASTGTFESQPINTGGNLNYGIATWTQSQPTNTTIGIKFRTDPDGNFADAAAWTACGYLSGGGTRWNISSGDPMVNENLNCVNAGDQYIQYLVTMDTTNTAVSPTLSDITMNYDAFASGTLTSSAYDAQDPTNVLSKLQFSQTTSGTSEGQVVTDDFERASLGSNWTEYYGASYAHICNNSDFCGTDSFSFNTAHYNAQYFSGDQFSEGVISAIDGTTHDLEAAVVVRQLDNGRFNWYELRSNGYDSFTIDRYFNDAQTTIFNIGAPYPQVGDTIKLTAVGSTLTAYVNGSPRGSVVDTNMTSGWPGLRSYGTNGTGEFESWRGGNIITGGGSAKFQLQTSADNSSWGSWLGPTGTGDFYTDPNGATAINSQHTDGSSDRYFRYQATLTPGSATTTPILTSVTSTYVVNASPEFQAAPTASQGSDGVVSFSYSIRDPDTTSGTTTPGYVTPSYEYSLDNGSSWNPITTGLSAGATSNKAVQEVAYTNYNITWTAKSQIDGTYAAQAQIRVLLDDNEGANNQAQNDSASFVLDVKDPTLGSPAIAVDASVSPADVSLNASDDSSLQMCVTLDNTQTNCLAYAATTTIALATNPDTVYVIFKDSKGNTASANAVTPETPQNVIIRDLSNIDTNEYQLFVSWRTVSTPLAQFAYYRVWHSTDGTNYTLLASISDRSTNYYLHQGLTDSTTHYYKITTEDTSGDLSVFSSVVSDVVNGQGGSDSTPPTISNVATASLTTQSATITWDTDELADSSIGYSTTSGDFSQVTGVASMVDNDSGVGHHSVVLTNLSPSTTYYFRVQSTDPSGNIGTSDNGGGGYSFATIAGPSIINVTTPSIENAQATIAWQTNIAADSTIVYSTNDTLSSPVTANDSTPVTSHEITLTGLSTGTRYYFKVESGTATDTNGGVYYSFVTTSDSTPPVITNVNDALVIDTQALLKWDTNEKATSQVSYGTQSGAYPQTTTLDSVLNLSHAVTLSSLLPQTTYFYVVSSVDAAGNSSTSSEHNFTTLDQLLTQAEAAALTDSTAPTISAISVSGLDAHTATVSWTTNESANSFLEFTPTGGTATIFGDWVYGTSHQIALTTLDPQTAYAYRVISADKSGNIATSTSASFTTLALSQSQLVDDIAKQLADIAQAGQGLPAPLIGGQPSVSTTATSASISWVTDTPTVGTVSYSNNSDYQNTKSYAQFASTSNNYGTTHTVSLTGLSPNTTYVYQVQATPQAGPAAQSANLTFQTPDRTFAIDNYTVENISDEAAIFRWTTTEDSTSVIQYIPYRNGQRAVDEIKEQREDRTNFIHQLTVNAFEPGTRYSVSLISVNSSGLQTSLTLDPFVTQSTDAPPTISNIRVDSALSTGEKVKVQTIVAWQTDKPATSQILYRAGVQTDTNVEPDTTPIDPTYTKRHVVVLTTLESGKVYQIQVRSTDSNNQEVTSNAVTFLTPQQQQSVFQVIINTFQRTFGWTRLFQ